MRNHIIFKYFEEISSIPRGSGDTDGISNYLVEFAKKHSLAYHQDTVGNVLITKPGSKGREQEAPVIIQGHIDMVCEKTKESLHDFENQGLELIYGEKYLTAKDTTLGADDGIAVAYALAILESENLSHPPIEAVFTVDEEIGMLGAAVFDYSLLKGTRMLNLDSEEEGEILVGCAGGMTVDLTIPMEREKNNGIPGTIRLYGLKGGHSGVEIHKERANAVKEMGRVLDALNRQSNLHVIDVKGGLKDNAIPRECVAHILVDESERGRIEELIAKFQKELSREYRKSDEGVKLELCFLPESGIEENTETLTKNSQTKLCAFLQMTPNGVQNYSMEIPGLVETSLNLGIFEQNLEELKASYSVRSSVSTRKEALAMKLCCLSEMLGGTYESQGNYPAWEYKGDSMLRPLAQKLYKEMMGVEPKVNSIHAGVECGYFMQAKPELDIISYGPEILDIHTVEERMNIESAVRNYEYTIEILKTM